VPEIVVVSDGSTDATHAALAGLDEQAHLIELPRSGKPAALNAAVAAASGEIVVFADARQRFAHDAVLRPVANFTDLDVGGVTGELVLDSEFRTNDTDSTVGDGVGLYWRYEKWLRTVASIPGGAYSAAVAETAGEAGIRTLFTSEPREHPWTAGTVVCLGRYVVRRGMSADAALRLVQGRGAGRFRQRILWDAKKLVKFTCGPAYREFRRGVLAERTPFSGARGTGLPPPR
jgi:glycosyltransferase involved in cell wall biosynthesis